jgi:hypothetical protein
MLGASTAATGVTCDYARLGAILPVACGYSVMAPIV